MQSHLFFRTSLASAAIFLASFTQGAYSQDAARREIKPLSPRAAATDYQSVAQAGTVTIAADFEARGVPTADGTFSTERFLVVELGIYGPPGARLNLSYKDFSLRVNDKKTALPAQPYEMVFGSLKDPEWAPPVPVESKSNNGINAGGQGRGQGDPPPAPPKMALPLVLAMEQKVKMASLPEGERALPTAGLVFFSYGGNTKSIHSLELIYTGAAGKASLPLQ